MTDELDPGDGMRDHIVEFVSCGPKNCGYRTKREKTEVKVRELNLNVRGSEMLHFESRKRSLKPRCWTSKKNGGQLRCRISRSSTGIRPPRYSRPFVRTRRGAWSLTGVWSKMGGSSPFPTATPGFHRKRNEEVWDGWAVDGHWDTETF